MKNEVPAAPAATDDASSPQLGPSLTLRRDATVEPAYGSAGRLKHVILDPDTREVVDLGVAFQNKEWLVPVQAVTGVHDGSIKLPGARYQYEKTAFRRAEYQCDNLLATPRKRSQGARHSGVPLLERNETAVSIRRPLPPEAEQPVTTKRPYRLELRDERLRIRKQNEMAAQLRVTRRTVERIQTIEVPIREEVAVLELIGAGTADPVVVDGQTLRPGEPVEITLSTERVYVSKEQLALADVEVRTQVVQREQRVQQTLRREELAVDDPEKLAVHRYPSAASSSAPPPLIADASRGRPAPRAGPVRPDRGVDLVRPDQAKESDTRVSTLARVAAVSAAVLTLLFSVRSATDGSRPSTASAHASRSGRRMV